FATPWYTHGINSPHSPCPKRRSSDLAMSAAYSSDDAILEAFYESEEVRTGDAKSTPKLEGRVACGDIVDPMTGEVLVESGATISDRKSTRLNSSHVKNSYAVFCLNKK